MLANQMEDEDDDEIEGTAGGMIEPQEDDLVLDGAAADQEDEEAKGVSVRAVEIKTWL
jgi:hypothetical protein